MACLGAGACGAPGGMRLGLLMASLLASLLLAPAVGAGHLGRRGLAVAATGKVSAAAKSKAAAQLRLTAAARAKAVAAAKLRQSAAAKARAATLLRIRAKAKALVKPVKPAAKAGTAGGASSYATAQADAQADAYAKSVWPSAHNTVKNLTTKFPTPPMGWNNYNAFLNGIDETIFKQTGELRGTDTQPFKKENLCLP